MSTLTTTAETMNAAPIVRRHHDDGRPVFKFSETYCEEAGQTLVVSRVRTRKNTRVEMKDIVEFKMRDGEVTVIDLAAALDKGKGKEPATEGESESDSGSDTDEEGDPEADEPYEYIPREWSKDEYAEGDTGADGPYEYIPREWSKDEKEVWHEEEDEYENENGEWVEEEEEEDVWIKDA